MPKKKTHRGAKKRFAVTKNGRVKFKRTKMRHKLTKKNSKMKRQLRKTGILSPCDEKIVRKMLNKD